jgi:hypothetical protein
MRGKLIGAIAAALTTLGACAISFTDYPSGLTGGGGAGASGPSATSASGSGSGSGSSTATGGSTTFATGAGPSGSTSSTGTGGSGSKTCQVLHDTQDCGAGARCTIVDENTGTLGCVPLASMPLGKYDACTADTSCPAGTWCDQRTLVCDPFCATGDGCGSGQCVGASSGTKSIPGVNVCTAHCDPESASPCGTGSTCSYDDKVLDFDCFTAGAASVAGSCQSSLDCKKGLVCAVNAMQVGTCYPWCHAAGTFGDCTGTFFCNEFTPAFVYDGADYGYCN